MFIFPEKGRGSKLCSSFPKREEGVNYPPLSLQERGWGRGESIPTRKGGVNYAHPSLQGKAE